MEAIRTEVNASLATRPCRRRWALLVALAVIPLFAFAARASAATWHTIDGGAPATVRFTDIATAKVGPAATLVVVAVGEDDATAGTPQAVIYRNVGGNWYADTITWPTTPAPKSSLGGVAIAGAADGVAWAVGTADGKPLALRIDATKLTTAASVSWDQTTIPDAMNADTNATRISAIALQDAPSGQTGALGYVAAGKRIYSATDNGHLSWSIDAAINVQQQPQPTEVPANGGIEALTLYAPGMGYAAAAKGDGTTARVFTIDGTSVTAAPAVDPTSGCSPDIAGIAATQTIQTISPPQGEPQTTPVTSGVAIDTPSPPSDPDEHFPSSCWWNLDQGSVWDHLSSSQTTGMQLTDVAMATFDNHARGVIAGNVDGRGAVWTCVDSCSTRALDDTIVPAPSLRAVAIVAADDIWVAGDGGVIGHYFTDPPTQQTDGGGGGDTGAGGGDQTPVDNTGSGSGAGTDLGSTGGTTDITGGDVPVQVVQPTTTTTPTVPHKKKRKHRRKHRAKSVAPTAPTAPGRLMVNVAVKKAHQALVISFTLTAPAVVAVYANQAGHQVTLSKGLRLHQGPGKLIIRYAGKRPPAALRIVVRPVRKAGSGAGS